MSDPICYTRPSSSLSAGALTAVQSIARQAFTQRRPVQESEMLWSYNLVARYREIVGNPALRSLRFPNPTNYLIDPIARRVVDAMHVSPEIDQRTHTNITRLFSSDRISTSEIIGLLTALANHNQEEFNGLAHRMFFNAGLFYYVSLDSQNTAICFRDR